VVSFTVFSSNAKTYHFVFLIFLLTLAVANGGFSVTYQRSTDVAISNLLSDEARQPAVGRPLVMRF